MRRGRRMSWYLKRRRGGDRETLDLLAGNASRSNSAHDSSPPRHRFRELCSQQTLSIACHWSCAAPQLEGFSSGQWCSSSVELRLPEDPQGPGIPVARAGSSVQQPTAFLIISPRSVSRRTSFLRVLHRPRPVSFPLSLRLFAPEAILSDHPRRFFCSIWKPGTAELRLYSQDSAPPARSSPLCYRTSLPFGANPSDIPTVRFSRLSSFRSTIIWTPCVARS